MLKRFIVTSTIVSVVVLGVLLTTTTPSTAGPLGILGLFVCLYMAALGVLTFTLYGLSAIGEKLPITRSMPYPRTTSFKVAYYYASVGALAPVMLIAMQSVGSIGIYQILLVVVFLVVAWAYIKNRTV